LNLIEALEICKKPFAPDARPFNVFLACGFTPLHLQTFLAAHVRQGSPALHPHIKTGLYGDLAGSLERLNPAETDVVVVAIEWPDLDPRLGVRVLGGWNTSSLSEIVRSAESQLARIDRALRAAARSIPVVISTPTLLLPPLFYTAPDLLSAEKAQLLQAITSFMSGLAPEPHIRVVDSQALSLVAPLDSRHDLKSEIATGFPYKLPFASVLGDVLASLAIPRSPKKGLITDLDDTVWSGILGEVGVDGVSWSLDEHAQIHGLYQQFLASLASAGILVGVASKNDPTLVQQAFDRKDLLLKKENVFPFEVHWHRKSESVQRILKAWNIGPEAVIFIDDSGMEAAEVRAAFPQMECHVFKQNDYQSVWDLLVTLRSAFGKNAISQEDAIRLQSLRNAAPLLEAVDGHGTSDEFLKQTDAVVTFDYTKSAKGGRAFELVNKTNQFNLNGRRLTESAWSAHLADPSSFLVTISYQDRFGPLGKIAVVLGRRQNKKLLVNSWVMSCRAFSRRIEHQTLKQLFEKFDADSLSFDFQPTDRNGPLQDLFKEFWGAPDLRPVLSRDFFYEKAPRLFHRVEEVNA
jgi:FkbH-like protein